MSEPGLERTHRRAATIRIGDVGPRVRIGGHQRSAHFRERAKPATMRGSLHTILSTQNRDAHAPSLVRYVRHRSSSSRSRARSSHSRPRKRRRWKESLASGHDRSGFGRDRAAYRAQGALDRAGGHGRTRVEHRAESRRARAPSTSGSATGGIMKSADNGSTFQAIFEHEAVAAIGDIAVAPSDPKTIYVGTGEANDRNTVSWGAGVYCPRMAAPRGPESGLEKTRAIARIVVHPTDPKTAWVCAPGDVWQPGERGIYKTTDGGKSWKKVYGAPAPFETRAGCGDLAIDPSDPNVLYATLYARLRRPWVFTYGAAATDGKDMGGVFKSTDGGAPGRSSPAGCPTMTGRIGLAVYAKNPKTVFALVQSDARRHRRTSTIRTARRAACFAATMPAQRGRGRASSIRAPSTSARFASTPRTTSASTCSASCSTCPTTAARRGARTASRTCTPTITRSPSIRAAPSACSSAPTVGCTRATTRAEGWAHLNRFAGRRVLSREHGQLHSVPDLRRAAGQHELGRHRATRAARKAYATRTGSRSAAAMARTARSIPADSNLVYAESQQGFIFRFDLRERAGQESSPAARGGAAGVPLPLDVTARSRARTTRASSITPETACSSSRITASSGT